MQANQPHILLSSMGAYGPKPTPYQFGESVCESQFSAFGIWQLLPEDARPDCVWFLLTPLAREKAWTAIQHEAKELGIAVHAIDLPGDVVDDTAEFLELAATQLPADCRLTLNVTEGLRHHAFLFYALALYLEAFRNIEIAGVWYCRWETGGDADPKPIIDLKPILELARWFHALGVFRETGSLREVANCVSDRESQQLMRQASDLFMAGLPLETGDAARKVLDHAESQTLLPPIPLRDALQQMILDELRPLASSTEPKKQLSLTESLSGN